MLAAAGAPRWSSVSGGRWVSSRCLGPTGCLIHLTAVTFAEREPGRVLAGSAPAADWLEQCGEEEGGSFDWSWLLALL